MPLSLTKGPAPHPRIFNQSRNQPDVLDFRDNEGDTELPAYHALDPAMKFEHPPSYFDSTRRVGGLGFNLESPNRGHKFASTYEVQLTPTEVALLRDGWGLDIWVAIVPAPLHKGIGLKKWLRLWAKCYSSLMKVKVRSEDVDDYGRWRNSEPRERPVKIKGKRSMRAVCSDVV